MGNSIGFCSPAAFSDTAVSAQKRLNCHKYLHINWKKYIHVCRTNIILFKFKGVTMLANFLCFKSNVYIYSLWRCPGLVQNDMYCFWFEDSWKKFKIFANDTWYEFTLKGGMGHLHCDVVSIETINSSKILMFFFPNFVTYQLNAIVLLALTTNLSVMSSNLIGALWFLPFQTFET